MKEGHGGGLVVRRQVEIKNRLGLHARAAAQLVQALARFHAEVTVSKDGQTVSGKSILGLMMLAAGQGSRIELTAWGPDAAIALDTITTLVEKRFNEEA